MKKIDCFLLAAGEANRMYPLNQILEKSLLPVNGKPVIRHIVDNLTVPEVVKHIRNITICCLIKFQKQFEHEFRDMPSIKFDPTRSPDGTATAWKYMIWHKKGYYEKTLPEWCMVHYADCLTDIDYNDFISKIDDKYDGLIAITNTVKHDYSEVFFHPDNRVINFYEKPKILNHTWSGIGLFKTKNVIDLVDNAPLDFAFDIFPKMIKQGKLKAYPYNGEWVDVGNLTSYRKICEKFENGELK